VSSVDAQHMLTSASVTPTPACPTIHESRRNKMMPRMFCMHGRNTPMRVPSSPSSASDKTDVSLRFLRRRPDTRDRVSPKVSLAVCQADRAL
jgi:hypothetical protein